MHSLTFKQALDTPHAFSKKFFGSFVSANSNACSCNCRDFSLSFFPSFILPKLIVPCILPSFFSICFILLRESCGLACSFEPTSLGVHMYTSC